MLGVMTALAIAGFILLFGAPFLARAARGPGGDPIGLTRMLQIVAVVLLVGALFLRPRNPETTAVPPPPDVMDTTTQ